jgi:FkbM family methyltransferase
MVRVAALLLLLTGPNLADAVGLKRLNAYNASEAAPVGKSQFGQDDWVLQKHPGPGYFLDLGAFHPTYGSNSWALEQHHWNGICVEPVPKAPFSARSCKMLKVAVSDVDGTFTFRKCKDPQLSGLTDDAKTRRFDCMDTQMPVRDVRGLLKENLPAGMGTIDYVSLDVEGTELKILKAWPWSTHCVKLWTIEHNNLWDKGPIGTFLEGKGCTMKSVSVDWWVECPCPA